MKNFEIVKENGFVSGANECLIVRFKNGCNGINFNEAVELVQEKYSNAEPQMCDWQDENGNIDQYGEYLYFE